MIRKKPFTYKEYKNLYSKVPRLCVDIVIETEEGFLLTLRKFGPSEIAYWHLPGGTVLLNESLHESIDRISVEELGATCLVGEFLGYIEYPSTTKITGFGYVVSLVFKCQLKSPRIILDELASEYSFFDKLPENTFPEQKIFLNNLLNSD